jgi:biuret amidohydrolase
MMRIATRQQFFELDLRHAALVVIDLQNDFCHADGFCHRQLGADIHAVRGIIPRVQAVITWARDQGVPVIYTRESHAPDLSDATAAKQVRYANAGYPIGSLGPMGRFLIRGEPGCALIEELQPIAGELQLDKPAQSIFIGTTLAATLGDQGITHLLFTGVTTACCVLASYRQASDLGFYGLLLEDCCAAFSAEEQAAAIAVLLGENGAIGWVATSAQLFAASG